MPEGPEVRLNAERLVPVLEGRTITSIEHTDDKLADFIFILDPPATVVKVGAIGKLLYMELSDTRYITNHLMLTGCWYINHEPSSWRLKINLDNGSTLYFKDSRLFGTFKVLRKEAMEAYINNGVPDMLRVALGEDEFSLDQFREIMQKRKRSRVGTILKEGKKALRGIGNYLRAEILYNAKINPHRLVGDLSPAEIETLYNSILEVIGAVYRQNGSSNYNQEFDIPGNFYEFQIYRLKKDPLGNPIISEKLGSQSIYWVPEVQK